MKLFKKEVAMVNQIFMNKMKYNIKKLYGNMEKDDDDFCHKSGNFKLKIWIKLGQIVQINLKSQRRKINERLEENKPLSDKN